ncbi:MAG: 3-oxoadipate enol-lactonase [Acidimicrobiaceae bacterium]|nr:3-oxoadipate enol-lactonase [Acidimicrobiaceae bacterium]
MRRTSVPSMRVDIGDGVRLYFDVEGLGLVPEGPVMVERPTIVYLHGGPGMDHSIYKTGEPNPLTDVAQCVYYDHRGNGRSDRRDASEWNLDMWADDVVRLCDALGIDHPIVFGASFGGFVAQRYLARHPEHPAKVILACTGARIDLDVMEKAFTRFGGEIAGATARKFFAGDLSVMGDFLQHCMPLYSTEPVDPDTFARIMMNADVMSDFFPGEGQRMDLRAGLAAAQCPVLVLAGDADPVMPVEVGEEIQASLPGGRARFEVLAGKSHFQVGDHTCAPLLTEFILS